MTGATQKIVAIGGGEIGRPGYPVETTAIDREIVRLTGKKHPTLLFIPTASSDSVSYYEVVKKHFGKRLGCKTNVLYLVKEKPSLEEIRKKILTSDIVYVGGGNTFMMMRIWRNGGVDQVLREAYRRGIVLSGMSAGSICWFRHGSSDSRRFANPAAELIKVSGLGLIEALHCPHYDVEKDRGPDLQRMMKKTSGVAIAIDNCCAIEIVNGSYRVLSSKKKANAYKVYWRGGRYFEEKIANGKKFISLKELLKK